MLRKRLAANGFDITQLPTWSRIDQLRLVANTVKQHADGDSADSPKVQRPEFFEPHHANGELTAIPFRYAPSVYRPRSGEDLYPQVPRPRSDFEQQYAAGAKEAPRAIPLARLFHGGVRGNGMRLEV